MWTVIMMIASFALVLSEDVVAQKIRAPGSFSEVRGFDGGNTLARNGALFLRIPKLSLDYLLGPRDELKIEIVGQETLNQVLQTVKISNSGEISIPFLGAVQAADLTAAGLEAKIASLLTEKQLVRNPEVLVYVTDYQAKPIYIAGEVDNPGEYMMSQQMTLMEFILMAGGIDPDADRYGFLQRRIAPGSQEWKPERTIEKPEVARPGREVIKVDLQPLKTGGVLKPDIALRKGDVFVVPRREVARFYVIGDVKSPGAYEIPPPPERLMMVTQAISQAGGPGKTAKMSQGLVVRYGENRQRVEQKVDFAAILKGKHQDFGIHSEDIIFIPGSNAKTLGYGMLGMIPQTVQNSVKK